MRKFLVLLLVATSLLSGCFDNPMNFSCNNTGNSDLPESLSIKNGVATLNFTTYNAECHKMGNSTTYAVSKEECKLAGDSDARYSLQVFDNVVFTAYANSGLGNGKSFQKIYSCKKVS